jgi:hypothetical protein
VKRTVLPGLLLACLACRAGHVAGTGASCVDDDGCREGYVCQGGACVIVHASPARADASQPDAPSPRDAGHAEAGMHDGPPDQREETAIDGPSDRGEAIAADAAFADASGERLPFLGHCREYGLDGQPSSCAPAMSHANSLAQSRDGKRLALRITHLGIRILDRDGAGGWQRGRDIPVEDVTMPTALSPDGQLVANGGFTLGIWEVSSGKRTTQVAAVTGQVNDVVGFAADNDRLLSTWQRMIWSNAQQRWVSYNVNFWSSSLLLDPASAAGGPWWCAAILQDAAGTMSLNILDLDHKDSSGANVALEHATIEHPFSLRALSAGAQRLALMEDIGLVLWDLSDKTNPQRLLPPLRPSMPGELNPRVSFAPDGKTVAVMTLHTDFSADADLLLYDVSSRRLLGTRTIKGGISGGLFTADGAGLLVLSGYGCDTLIECRD